jgi:stearoyl-CoA desaturase (delta-9 desaturase)
MKYIPPFANITQLLGYSSLLFLLVYTANYGFLWFVISLVYYKIFVGLLGNQIGQHRYFSHNSFKTGPKRHLLLSAASTLTGISPIVYAGIHRHHHVHSDTEKDPHSPLKSIWHSFIGWTINNELKVRQPVDLIKNPVVIFTHKNIIYILGCIILLTALADWKISVFCVLAGFGWNSLHMGLFRTVGVHIKLPASYRNFETTDNSWNNKIIQMIDIGEGLHNNHHQYPNRYNQAVTDKEFDPAGWIIDKFFKE